MKVGVTEALRMVAMRANKSLAQLSKEITKATPAAFVNMVARGSMKMSVGASFGEQCGYALMFVPIDQKDSIVDGIEIKGEVEVE